MDGQLMAGYDITTIKKGKHMLELTKKAIMTLALAQTTSDVWLGFVTRDGKVITIKGRKANGDFCKCAWHILQMTGKGTDIPFESSRAWTRNATSTLTKVLGGRL